MVKTNNPDEIDIDDEESETDEDEQVEGRNCLGFFLLFLKSFSP